MSGDWHSYRDHPSTPNFYQAVCLADNFPDVEIHVCSTGQTLTPYLKYILSNVMISHYQELIREDKQPMEVIQLNFTKVQKTYIGRDSSNQSQSPTTFGFDLETAKKL